ncbi:MAG: thioredoxin family protein, partial [Chloroflexi bacterium]|nr:thioredoxin family protein [Chloroflexota bacterium]
MAITKQKFDQGMTPQEYIDQIKVNKQPFLDIYNALDVPDKAKALFDGLDSPLNLAVFTADWCGDAVSTTPVILRLAQATPGLSVQVFNRDDELEITNSFLPENRAGTVPVFIVMDSSMAEIARFVETALELVPAIDAMDDMIAKEIAGESEEDRRAAGRGRRMAFRTSHAQEWGEVIMESF